MLVNNYLITTTELKTLGYYSLPGIAPPADSLKMVSKLTATTYYDIPPGSPWDSYPTSRVPKYQDFPIACYCYVTVENTLAGNPDPVPIQYQDCSGNIYYSSVPFGQSLIINPCYYVSGDSGPLTGCGVLPGSVYAAGCTITYSTRRDVAQDCTTTSTTSTTTTIAPNYCLIVAGYVDEADLNASYNFEVCFDWYDCDLNVVTYCTIGSGGFTLPSNCYQSDLAWEAYYYLYPGGPKVPACCSYLAGYNPCTPTTTTTTSSTTTAAPPVPCGTTSTYTGGSSYPTPNTVTLGSSTGTVSLAFNAQNVPDRFIVQWNSNYVIDTGYRGVSNYNFGGSLRSTFTSSLSGLVDPITGLTYPNTGQWPIDGYPAVVSPGNGTAIFSKNTSLSTTANVFVYAPIAGTAWTFTLSCPV